MEKYLIRADIAIEEMYIHGWKVEEISEELHIPESEIRFIVDYINRGQNNALED